jgi:hypothetical protein
MGYKSKVPLRSSSAHYYFIGLNRANMMKGLENAIQASLREQALYDADRRHHATTSFTYTTQDDIPYEAALAMGHGSKFRTAATFASGAKHQKQPQAKKYTTYLRVMKPAQYAQALLANLVSKKLALPDVAINLFATMMSRNLKKEQWNFIPICTMQNGADATQHPRTLPDGLTPYKI